jgi:hypothetical protein
MMRARDKERIGMAISMLAALALTALVTTAAGGAGSAFIG